MYTPQINELLYGVYPKQTENGRALMHHGVFLHIKPLFVNKYMQTMRIMCVWT